MNRAGVVLLAVVVAGIGVAAFFALRSGPKPNNGQEDVTASRDDGAEDQGDSSDRDSDNKPPHRDWVQVGGVWRPPTDVAGNGGQNGRPSGGEDRTDADAESKTATSLGDPGRSELIALDANPHVKSIAAALRNNKHPERLTSFVQPKPFDKEAFLKDPKSYLETIEPGRVYQSAQPADNVNRIKRLSARYQRVIQGETVTFRVEVEPDMPVTFHSTRLGRFENRLSTQTVRADEQGIAEVQFTATPGTQGDIDVLAASPTSSYQARFVVHVQLPKGPPDVTK